MQLLGLSIVFLWYVTALRKRVSEHGYGEYSGFDCIALRGFIFLDGRCNRMAVGE
jgi:hypothetical protein